MMNVVPSTECGMRNLVKSSELTAEQNKCWVDMIDEIILTSDGNKELKEGLKFFDAQALHQKITIYEVLLMLYPKDYLDEIIQAWKNKKTIES